MARLNAVEGLGETLLGCHIGNDRIESLAIGAKLLTQSGECLFRHVECDDVPTIVQQAFRRAPADARCSSRDGRNLCHGAGPHAVVSELLETSTAIEPAGFGRSQPGAQINSGASFQPRRAGPPPIG